MFDLVKKDFIIGGIFLAVIAVVIPFLTVMSVVTMIDTFGGLVLGFFIPMIIVLCVGSSFIFIGIDAVYDADTIYASLPVKKSKIIYARYFTSFIMILFSFTLIALTSLVSLHLFHKTDPLLMLFFSIRGIIGTILFLFFILIFYRERRKAPCFSNGDIRRKFFLLFVSQAAIRCVGRRTFGISLWSGDVGRHREAGTPNTKAPRGISWRIPAL